MAEFKTRVYRGTCDASAAVRLGDGGLFVTASDEDSVLRVYDRNAPGSFVHSHDLAGFLNPAAPGDEVDIEGAARIGSLTYWIGSHGRDSDGNEQESRQRLFATSMTASGGSVSIEPVGEPYTMLLRDLVESPALKGLRLRRASELPPKAAGGLSIEGLAPTPEGHLLIGFRNPIPDGKAMIVRLENPKKLIEGKDDAAVLSRAGLLDLGGRGIRAIEALPTQTYVIVAGAFDATRDFRVFRWSGQADEKPVRIEVPGLSDLNPEELIAVAKGESCEIELFSDDSDILVGEKKCKKLKDESRRTFRSLAVLVPMGVLTGEGVPG